MFTVQTVKNLQWVNPEHTTFDCVVKFAEFEEEMCFACTQTDSYQHSQEIWSRGLAGEFGSIAEYVEYVVEAAPDQPSVSGAQTL